MKKKSENFFVNPLAEDLDFILQQTSRLWEELRGQKIFITGGTGFFGCWLLETLAWANKELDLDARAVILTRNSAAFRAKAPHLAVNPNFSFLDGDIRTFDFPEGRFPYIIHAAATSAEETFQGSDAQKSAEVVVEGTRHLLEFAKSCGARKLLYTSSGVVSGVDPANNPGWGKAKLAAEKLCLNFGKSKIARCYSFIGPYLPLDLHYAVGNFIRDALAGGPIAIKGDGTALRSYLYAADLIIWLWTILFIGRSSSIYQVGSIEGISIEELARLIVKILGRPTEIVISKQPVLDRDNDRYLPLTGQLEAELGLRQIIHLEEAIRRTIAWHKHFPFA